MPTWYKDTGSSGTMKIVDDGSTIEFWLYAGASTFNHDLQWRYYNSGAWSSYRKFDFIGGSYRKLGEVTATTDRTVGFGIAATGTSGLGGPTSFTVSITRSGAPDTPGAWVVEHIYDTSVQGDTDILPNGGLAIDEVQVRYDDNTSASSPSYFNPGTDAYGTITGLARGKTYYFWVRSHNPKGWSPWSARTQATTHNFPPAPSTVMLSDATQSSVLTRFNGNGTGGSAVLEWQLAYGINATAPESTTTSTGTKTLTGLIAGKKYYFRARGRNTYGWGAWSAISSIDLKAGAYVDYIINQTTKATVKKRAVPYVKVNGVWRVVEPRVNIKGLWKPTA